MVDAREYHERTKHSPRSVREDSHRLDRSNLPRPYKVYTDLPRVEAPDERLEPEYPALSAVATSTPDPSHNGQPSAPDAFALSALCHYATGVTRHLRKHGRELRFRAAACTGKLYHVDLYAVCGDVGPWDAGVYHYDPDGDAFDVLREGDYRGVLADAADGHAGVADAPVTFVATSTWWRNAWKYRERTYRHAFWDSGTILANLLATAHGLGRRAEVVVGFADDPVTRLLGLDPTDEAPLELVPVGAGASVPDAPTVDDIDPATEPLSEDPQAYPILADAWEGSALSSGEAADWRESVAAAAGAGELGTTGIGDGERVELAPVDRETQSARPVAATIQRRGSLREYSHEPISDRKLATILDRALGGVPTDSADADGTPTDSADTDGTPTDSSGWAGARPPGQLIDCYCLVHAVDGVPSGAYQYHPAEDVLERLGDTDRETAAHLALDQEVVGDAAVNVYLLADVDAIVEAVGNRGYRLAQLEGGLSLGRLYLATYAHRALGGRGFTFYDDLVTEHLSPRASSQTPMTLFAFGKPSS